MSRRVLLGLGAALGLLALAVVGLAALGSQPSAQLSGGWTGWTGREDPAATADLAAMTPDDAVAVALLARAATATARQAYSGRAESVDADGTSTADLAHVPGRGTVVTALTPTPGAPALHPDGGSGSLVDSGRPLALLRVHYRVLREADLDERIAGRPADAVVAVGEGGAVAARFWLDHATGILLRKQLVAADGSVLATTGFTTFRLGVDGRTSIPPTTTDSFGAVLTSAKLAGARSGGCACPEALPGGLTLLETRQAAAGTVTSAPVVHQVFSDGLRTVSLFAMPGAVSDADAADLRARGFTARVVGEGTAWVRGGRAWTAVWQHDAQVLTLVVTDAEDPTRTATAVLEAMPPAADTRVSFAERVRRGWDRVTGGGW